MAIVSFKGGYMDGETMIVPDNYGLRIMRFPQELWNSIETERREIIHRYRLVRKSKSEIVGIYEGFEENPMGNYPIVDDQLKEDPKAQERIRDFMLVLLKNTQDLDPAISKLVDEHFWELEG